MPAARNGRAGSRGHILPTYLTQVSVLGGGLSHAVESTVKYAFNDQKNRHHFQELWCHSHAKVFAHIYNNNNNKNWTADRTVSKDVSRLSTDIYMTQALLLPTGPLIYNEDLQKCLMTA
jgi:hypothetical protein